MTSSTKFENYCHVFRDIIRAMHSSTRLQKMLQVVVIKSTEILDAQGALLRILNKETNQFDVRSACGLCAEKCPKKVDDVYNPAPFFCSFTLVKTRPMC
jgi:hypothetical protein